MKLRQYLPSAQFSVLVVSVALSVGLVFLADAVTRPPAQPSTVAAVDSDQTTNQDESQWQSTLAAVQDSQTLGSLPTPPDETLVNGLLQGAQSNNITESIGRSLLVKITNAKAQGLGDDIPTQNQLISEATKQLSQKTPTKTYSQSDLVVVADTSTNQHTFGNAVMSTLAAHPGANMAQTLYLIGQTTDNNDPAQAKKLGLMGDQYRALTNDLARVPTPKTLVPLYLVVVNNYAKITDTFDDMQTMISDPLRGLAGIQQYQSLTDETQRMFTNIAQALHKNGILFTKDEPGAVWSFLAEQQ